MFPTAIFFFWKVFLIDSVRGVVYFWMERFNLWFNWNCGTYFPSFNPIFIFTSILFTSILARTSHVIS